MMTSTPPRRHPLLGQPPGLSAGAPAEPLPGGAPGMGLLLCLLVRRLAAARAQRLRYGQLGVAVERAVRLRALLAEALAQER